MEGFMRSSSYFKTISRFLWVVGMCLFGTSCLIAGLIENFGPEGRRFNDFIEELNYCESDCQSDIEDCIKSRGLTIQSKAQCDTEKKLCSQQCYRQVRGSCVSKCYSEQSTCKSNSPNNDQDYQCAKQVQRCFHTCYRRKGNYSGAEVRGKVRGGQCYFPCYAKFSDCMGKVTGAALTEHICIVERDSCFQQCGSMEEEAGSNQYTWCQDESNRWTLCKAP
jgi:hypothetical protein